ncbi:Calcium influx-promoting protein ehs1 [Wickerhamiella sorbophila]|uniref:Calcium influx-promoting protein ehs1 n=1 Tax=Wickerhamiella sorbophila TaxID=45607 RepID=A0A2T0FIM3_9ASCO|nr:Calcium influx-promoting protein ehs1 [Wickerhamiella sorbophila]PRT54854.1 Calcium influx-promoting protein ehs1 [Wickerhamiella sorbophila]
MDEGNATFTKIFEYLNIFQRESILTLSPLGAAAEISANDTHIYTIPPELKDSLLSLSTCTQPDQNYKSLELVVGKTRYSGEGGLVTYSAGGLDVVQVIAPQGEGSWTYELGVGPSASYALNETVTDLFFVDSDFANSLLVTSPLTELQENLTNIVLLKDWGDSNPVVTIDSLEISLYTSLVNTSNVLYRSYCAIHNNGPLLNQKNADLSYTNRGTKHQTRAQYLLPGLNHSTEYVAYLTYANAQLNSSASPPPLGGISLGQASFSTTGSFSCQLVYNMTFCSEMAFAVPGNASAFSVNELTMFYDNMARKRYENFSKSLEQELCQGKLDDRYSVLRSCGDCDSSYRNWLCAITVPRCADWSSNGSYLHPRPKGQSRNPEINKYIDPGPYKEVLPCKELCYDLVRDCPASLGFSCPNKHMINLSYGSMSDDGYVTCSYPGAVFFEDAAHRMTPPWLLLLFMLFLFL